MLSMTDTNEYGEISDPIRPESSSTTTRYASETLHRLAEEEYDLTREETARIYNTVDSETPHNTEIELKEAEEQLLKKFTREYDENSDLKETARNAFQHAGKETSPMNKIERGEETDLNELL